MARANRLHQNVTNMVAALVVVMLGVGAVYFTTMRTDSDQTRTFDFSSELSIARAQATSFTPVRPVGDQWKVRSATFTRPEGVQTWRVGVELPRGGFLWIEQVDGQIDAAFQRWSKDGRNEGSLEVLGVPRQKWSNGDWRALTFADEGVALGVYGKASFEQLAQLAQSLSGS